MNASQSRPISMFFDSIACSHGYSSPFGRGGCAMVMDEAAVHCFHGALVQDEREITYLFLWTITPRLSDASMSQFNAI